MFFERARDLFSTFLIFQIVQGVTGYGWGGGQIIFRTGTHPPFSVCTNPEQVYSKFKHMDLKSQYFTYPPTSYWNAPPIFPFAQTKNRYTASLNTWISNHSTSRTHLLKYWNSHPLSAHTHTQNRCTASTKTWTSSPTAATSLSLRKTLWSTFIG